ncbi:type II secretion system F family protein [Clostridium weizhouense]|uniref:Type II secretion system F family protein n=1 Tax=Clostridium weizhouense TaxID=2859781 RepID=A0ABS7AQH8_9CLOT|nr:type II secretion system F family protein [Clostridium weizhouense]MBW6410927.1 type II secretion system F family protein [Clostridium weizhouense]
MSVFKFRENFIKNNFSKVNYRELSLISGNLAHLYKDGIPINDAIGLIKEVTLNRSYKESLEKVVDLIQEGKSLSEAFGYMPEFYPKFFIGIISIGENSGKLYEVLCTLKNYYSKRVSIKKEIINSITYPLIILTSIIFLVIFMMLIVIPNFYEIYLSIGTTPPLSCSILYKISVYFKSNIILSVISIICWFILAPIIAIKGLSNTKNVYMFKNIKIINDFFEYIIVLILSIIVNSGVNISYGLKYCSEGMNLNYLSNKLNHINKNILTGESLTEALIDAEGFSKYTVAIVRIREESGSIGEGLNELSISLQENLSKRINKYLSFLQPFLIIFMSILITIFFIAFILPLFDALKSGIR